MNTADNTESYYEKEEVKGTPFTIITLENRIFGTIGEHRITEYSTSKTEIRKELEKITWNRIVQVLAILIEKLK